MIFIVKGILALLIFLREIFNKGRIYFVIGIILLIALDVGLSLWNENEKTKLEKCEQYQGILKGKNKSKEYPEIKDVIKEKFKSAKSTEFQKILDELEIDKRVHLRSFDNVTSMSFKPNVNSRSMEISGEPLFLDLVNGEARISLAFRNKYGKVFGYINNNE